MVNKKQKWLLEDIGAIGTYTALNSTLSLLPSKFRDTIQREMKSIAVVALFIALLGLTVAYPASVEWDPEQGDKFEGDIVLSREQKAQLLSGARNGLIAEQYRWPEGKVYYKFFEGQFDEAHKNHILRGMEMLEEISCIRFYPANDSTIGYINITGLADGCYSEVGFLDEVQTVNFQIYTLDTGCFRLGTIVHEFLHSLGFFHQQSASDRDDFVEIVFENIRAGMEDNFEIYDTTVIDDFGIEYDYGSVLHYGPTAFSKNGERTIITLDPTAVIGQRLRISPKDIYKLNIMYKCPIPI